MYLGLNLRSKFRHDKYIKLQCDKISTEMKFLNGHGKSVKQLTLISTSHYLLLLFSQSIRFLPNLALQRAVAVGLSMSLLFILTW